MVMARLYTICGNCGCNDDFELKIVRGGTDITNHTPLFRDAAYLICGNCSTIHDLDESVKKVDSYISSSV